MTAEPSATPAHPHGTLTDRLPAAPEPELLVDAITSWTAEQGLVLYPAQEEALLGLVTDAHVILATPTGSGKSLVAVAAHAVALAQGRRSVYTAPLKALVSEKFFALVDVFGAHNVGMMTGDSAVNPGAPIVCCTAEILANIALRTGGGAAEAPSHHDDPAVPGEDVIGLVVMDEFHFYADSQRGWAWQVPLVELPRTQFLLMSATLGDTSFFAEDLQRRTGRDVLEVTSAQRPVPLDFSYEVEPLHEVVARLVETGKAPVYLVHFTQAAAVEQAQSLLSTTVASRGQRDAIAAELAGFRFATGFGTQLSRFLRHGVGVHHAGMLPRYRRLVERLTQAGLLTVVCGTDTLGVGINVPIRTVVLTSLVKFDGERSRHLTAREFHQIAGRAGRAGFDTQGDVVVMAPEHVIENRRALARAGDDERKRRKIVRKRAPEGHVNWTDKTFERLRDAPPEPLTSSFAVTHAMVLNVLARDGDPVEAMRHLLTANHEPPERRSRHVRRAIEIYRSLRAAGVVERVPRSDDDGSRHLPEDAATPSRRWTVRLARDIPADFALNQPLSPFAYAALDLLDPDAPSYALDVVSVVEATLENPRPVLVAQEKAARAALVAELKAEGYEYEERMALLEDVTYPQPLAELLQAGFATYRQTNPWAGDLTIAPKSVVREMAERAMTFAEFVSAYGIARSEGIVLRYLANAYRALRQTVPVERRDEALEDLIAWLGAVVSGTDSSLIEEWERLAGLAGEGAAGTGVAGTGLMGPAAPGGDADRPPASLATDPRALRVLARNAMFRRVLLAARADWTGLAALADTDADGVAWTAARWSAALAPYFEEHEELLTGPDARGPHLLILTEETSSVGPTWRVRQLLDDPEDHHDWYLDAVVDVTVSGERGELAWSVVGAGRL